MINKIQEHAALTPEDAFRKCCHEYVDVGQFMTAVLESRTPKVEQPVSEEPTEN